MLHLGFSLNQLLLCYLAMVVGNNELTTTKNADESLAILMAMAMQRYDTRRIAQWRTFRLHLKPLDAAIGQVPASYRPGGCHGRRFQIKHTKHYQNTTFS